MWVRKLPLLWVWLLLSLPLYGEVTEQERQRALEALMKVEGFTKVLRENSELRETYLNEIEKSLDERERLLVEKEILQSERERLQTEKETSLQGRENSLQVTKGLMEESRALYLKQEKRLKATSFWAKIGAVGVGVVGFLLGRAK